MTKNYIAVFHKAVNRLNRITLVFLLLIAVRLPVHAQQSLHFSNNTNSLVSQKGPFDYNGENATLDASPPVITYTPLSSTCATGNRTLTATITDADGVPTTGTGRPVLYWQINSGVFTPVTGISIGSNQYTFTFGIGAAAGNLVSYYIVAQDNAGNVIAKPSAGAGGYSTSPPDAATPPTAPDFYVIQTTLAAGSYNVGAGQPYLTLTDAVNAYNNSCLSGAIIFVLTDATYTAAETFPITINNPAASAVNTLTIKPNAATNVIIQGSAADAIIKLNGADYVTIDGSNSGGITKNLSIINDNTGTASNVIWLGSTSVSNGATHNTIKNCIISGNGANTTNAGIVSSSAIIAGQAAETANSDNSYINNTITTSYYGMIVIGPATGESNTIITNNKIGATLGTKKLGYRGLLISNQTNVTVANDTIIGIISSIGIGSDAEPTGGIIVSGAISGGNIYSNTINDIHNTNAGNYPAYGISLQSSSTNAGLKIYNNMIHSVTGSGNASIAGNNGIGIGIISGGGYGIYFNSIHLFAPQVQAGISSCLFIGSGVTGTASVDIRNNIFSSRRPNGTNYAIYISVPNIILSNINYNDYYSTGFIGFLGSNLATIASWQAATGMDGNSVTTNPIFANAGPAGTIDLHLQPISSLNDQAQPIAGITVDIDGTTRNPAPDIGADEFTPPVCSTNFGGTIVSDFITICTSGSVSLSSSGFSYGLGIAYQWEKSTTGPASGFTNVTGETNPTSANPPVITQTTWYRLRVTCAAGTPGYSAALQITVYDPHILTTTPGSRCGPGTVSLAATGTPTTAIQWYTAATGETPIFTGSPFITPSISTTTTYYAESVYLGSSGAVGPLSPTAEGGTISTQLTSWEVYFNVVQATKLLTVDVYPMASGENSTIDIYNSVGTMIWSVPYVTNAIGGATAQTVSINCPLPIGNGYYMYATNGIPAGGLRRNITGASYPYNSTDIVITGNGFDQTFYMCYYNWRFSNGCSSSPRTAVTATIGGSSSISITASPTSICAGSCTTLTASSSNTSFAYSWLPGPVTGSSVSVCPTSTTVYTVNATDGTCTATGSVTITVNPSSSTVVISPASVTKCPGSPAQLLTASGGDIANALVINEKFNGGAPPAGWVTGTNLVTPVTNGSVASKAWTIRPSYYSISGNTFISNDTTDFYLTQCIGLSGVTHTTLQTPAFSLTGYTDANLYFYHCYSFALTNDSATIEYATSTAGPWTKVKSWRNSRGASNKFRKDTISLAAYAGVAQNYLRFRFFSPGATLPSSGFFWAIDNVTISAGNNVGSPITWAPLTGLYTNAAGTIPYTGLPSTTIYVNPATTTTYTATATPANGCPSLQTEDVTIRTVTGSITGPLSVCPSGAANMSIALTGTGPWNLTYTDGVTPVTVNNIAVTPYTFTVNPLVTTTYTLTALSDTYCAATAGNLGTPFTVTVNPSAFSTWVGATTDWNDPTNWCGGIPTNTKDVVIPVTANSPVISTLAAVSRDISIAAGASLTINSGAVFSFKGNFINDGTIVNDGSIVMNGTTAQSFPGGTTGTITSMNNLEVNNAAGATINKDITITGTLKPAAGPITLNSIVITLKSDAAATARVDALGATASIIYSNANSKFSIERFISSASKPAWRFLSAPLKSDATQTINQAWQEGEAPNIYTVVGHGMQIVGPGGPAAGFDIANSITSLKTYNPTTNQWVTVPGTNIPITTTEGYMAFVRGDRLANFFGAQNMTVLRMAGAIKTGPIGPIGTANSSEFISVGNPYPSAIDFTATTRTGLLDVYYVWDPMLGSYGGYQTFSGATGYNPVPGLGSYTGGNKFIESGQAFFVKATAGAAPHSISFNESNKVSGSFQVQRTNTTPKELRTRLFSVVSGITNIIDGTLIQFDPSYSNAVDDMDAPKLSNFGENIGILKGGTALSVEQHAEIVNTDTVFFQLGQLRQQSYQLQFIATDLAAPGLTAYLEDLYLHSTTTINLAAVSIIDFIVNADPASKATDRFRIVFKQLGPVPVTFTSITAYRQEKFVRVNWKVENEINIDHYEIERSTEGNNFRKMGTQTANAIGGTSQYYWLDLEPFTGDNFYRIKSVGIGNDIKYSEIVKVSMTGEPSMITVYPNPVKDGHISISFSNEPKGDYDLKLFGTTGQLLLKQRITHPGGSQRIKIPLGNSFAKGIYNLEILPTGDKKRVFKIVIE